MGLTLAWSIEMMGIECPSAYLRLSRLTRQSEPQPDGSVKLGDTLFAEFLVYASQTARESRRDHIGNVAVRVTAPDWGADLAAQAYAAVKERYPDATDAI